MNLPNALTLSRIFLVPVLVAVLLTKYDVKMAAAIFLAASFTDLLDGYVARKRGQVTTLGVLLDPIADKLLISSAFISLVQLDPEYVPAWMVVIIIGREFAVSGLEEHRVSAGFHDQRFGKRQNQNGDPGRCDHASDSGKRKPDLSQGWRNRAVLCRSVRDLVCS